MPLATRGYDYVDGRPYADGGVTDPIPIPRAIQDGATDITVILTHNSRFRLRPTPRWLGNWLTQNFPWWPRAWTARQNVHYNAALDLMKQPPPGIRMRVFRPLGRCRWVPFRLSGKNRRSDGPGPRRGIAADGDHGNEIKRGFGSPLNPIIRESGSFTREPGGLSSTPPGSSRLSRPVRRNR